MVKHSLDCLQLLITHANEERVLVLEIVVYHWPIQQRSHHLDELEEEEEEEEEEEKEVMVSVLCTYFKP